MARRPACLPRLLVLCALALIFWLCARSVDAQPVAQPAGQEIPLLQHPFEAVKLAATDILSVPPEVRKHIRYVSLTYASPQERSQVWQTTSFLVNSFSRHKTIIPPLFVGETIIRINLFDYGIDPQAWDNLITNGSGPVNARSNEPYHYVHVKKLIEEKVSYTYRDTYGRTVQGTKVEAKTKRVLAVAPWLTPDGGVAFATLAEAARTTYPIARADWFIYFAAIAPAYYDFLFGVGQGNKLGDFEKRIFADPVLALKAGGALKGVVLQSGVGLHNRTLYRSTTAAGKYYWESRDSFRSIKDRDYVTVLLGERADAGEFIGQLSNGLNAYYVALANGDRLDVAAADIAIDSETRLTDKQVWAGVRNCGTCHYGVREVPCRVRALAQGQLTLLARGDVKVLKQLTDLYGTPLEPVIAADNVSFATSVLATNGLEARANARQFGELIWHYFEGPITLTRVAREAGTTPEYLAPLLRSGAALDHSLAGLVHEPVLLPRRDQFEQALPQLFGLLAHPQK